MSETTGAVEAVTGAAAGVAATAQDAVADVYILGLTVEDFTARTVALALAVVLALVVQRVLVRLLRRVLDSSNVPNASIFINLLRTAIWSVALLSVMKPVFGQDPAGVVAALGVVSVAISLGMQDTVSNIVSGLGLMMGKVVQPGDWVTVGSITGQVTDVTWRSTTVRSRGGNVEVIPNSVLNKTSLTHLTEWSATACEVGFLVLPAADLDAVAAEVLELAATACEGLVDAEIAPDVVFTSLTAYGTTGTVRLHAADGVTFSTVQDRMTRALQGKPWLANAL